jgi:metal-dependent hydrolase (beta-lactamase superfamily II)
VKGENGKYLMIDAGGYESAPDLEKDILSKGIEPRDIEMILISHGHWDHVAGARYFQEKYKIPVLVGKKDERLLGQGKSDKLCPTDYMAKSRLKDDETHSFQGPKVEKWIETETKARIAYFVVKIQTQIRMHKARMITRVLAEKRAAKNSLLKKAKYAVKIQCCIRRFLARRRAVRSFLNYTN